MSARPKRIGRPPNSERAERAAAAAAASAAALTSNPNSGTSTPTSSFQNSSNNAYPNINQNGWDAYSSGSATPHSMMNHHRNPSSSNSILNPSSKLLPNSWLLSSDSNPVKPNVAIGPGQAKYSTFASRMKAGTTALMTPISGNEGDLKDPTGGRIRDRTAEKERREEMQRQANANKVAITSSGRRTNVNYNEDTNDDDLLEEKEATKKEIREANKAAIAALNAANNPNNSKGNDPLDPEIDWTYQYLGLPPPGNKIVVRPAQPTDHHHFSEADLARAANKPEALIPIRIELETETHRIKDVFTWNVNETLLKPAHFAKILAQDLGLPLDPYAFQIEAAIHQQIEDLGGLAEVEIGPAKGGPWKSREGEEDLLSLENGLILNNLGLGIDEIGKESRQWDWGIKEEFERIKEVELKRMIEEKKERDERKKENDGIVEDEDDDLEEEFSEEEDVEMDDDEEDERGDWEDDIRVIVDYDLHILRHHLRDRFEWDLCSPLTPEAFSAKLCSDLALNSEAHSMISNAVREQLLNHKRAAIECDLVGSGKAWEKAVREIRRGDEVEERREREKKAKAEEAAAAAEIEKKAESSNDTEGVPQVASASVDGAQTSNSEAMAVTNDPVASTSNLELEATSSSNPSVPNAASREQRSSRSRSRSPTRPRASRSPIPTSNPIIADPSSTNASTPLPTTNDQSPSSTSSPILENPSIPSDETILELRNSAYIKVRDLISRGPRPLEDIWRDWYEGKEFGPLLQRLTDDDLMKIELETIRVSRRNRREQARFGTATNNSTARYRIR